MRRWVGLFAAAGLAVRAVLAIRWPTLQRPDEVFQNLEPAWRLLTGWGVVTWEWRDGIRSWLFPDALYAVMRAARAVDVPPLAAVAVALSVVAAVGVAVAVVVGWRLQGVAGAVLCGTLCAFWPDLVYFGPKPLLEVQAGNLLIVAAGLALVDRRAWSMAAIGVLLGLTFDLRFQLAPAVLLVAVWTAWLDWRRGGRRGWLALTIGAAVPVALLGAVDAFTWGSPFQSIWKNVMVNLLQNKADFYGVQPIDWYLAVFADRYGWATLLLAGFFCLGALVAPLLAAVTFVVVLSHTLIGHKEISFIYAALPPAIVTVGLGTASAVQRLRTLRRSALAGAAMGWLAVMLLTASARSPFQQTGPRAWMRVLWDEARARPDLCGLALYRREFPWAWTRGYSGLQRTTPIMLLLGPEALAQARTAFNYVIAEADDAATFPGSAQVACAGPYCLFHQPQACTSAPVFDINPVLARLHG